MSIHPKNPILKNPFLFVTFAYFFFQALPVDITTQPIQTSQEKAPVVAEMFLPSNRDPFIMPRKVEIVRHETEEILY